MKKAGAGPSIKKEKDDAANSPPLTDSWVQKKKKRTDSSDSTNSSNDMIRISFSSNASAQTDFEEVAIPQGQGDSQKAWGESCCC